MKAIVIGSALEGLRQAVLLRRDGWEVTLLASGTYLMQDVTETWRDYPLPRQSALCERLEKLAWELGLSMPVEEPLTPVDVKRLALLWMRQAGVQVRYLTRLAGLALHQDRLCGVLAADTTGLFYQPCQKVIDALPYAGGAAVVTGRPALFPAGSTVTLRLELMKADGREEWMLPNGLRLLPGGMSGDQVFVEKEELLPSEMTLRELRKFAVSKTDTLLHDLPREESALANAVPGTALPLCPDAAGALLPEFTLPGWGTGVGVEAQPDELLTGGRKLPWKEGGGVPLTDWELLPEKQADVCIVGMGTAGVWAAKAAHQHGAAVWGVELTPYMGGTRTLGGVSGRYYGNRSRFFTHMTEELSRYAKRFQPEGMCASVSAVTEILYYHAVLQDTDFAPCTLACAAKVRNGRISRVLMAGEEGIYSVAARQFIDASGNGALAVLAGCSYDMGDEAVGATQNYSQWNRCAMPTMGNRSIDQDTMDDTLPEEWTRTLENNLLTAREYDLYDSLTVRESRRVRGRGSISFRNVVRETHYSDALCESYSTYDPHGRCLDIWGRLGLMPALGKARYVSIPLRAVTVKEADNLLLAGKAISCDQDAFNYIRMSGDLAVLGWIEGCIAAGCTRDGRKPVDFPLKALQREMYELGVLTYLPAEDEDTVSPVRLVSGTLCSNRPAFHEAMLTGYPETEKLLLEACRAADGMVGELAMQLLLFYGHTDYAETLHQKLRRLVQRCGTIVYSDHQNQDGVSRCGMVNDQPDDYWEMNQLLMLLVRAGYEPVKETMLSMLNSTVPGGEWLNTASDYAHIRLDCQTIPNFDRIFCLAECAAQMPDDSFIPQLRRIYDETEAAPIYGASFYQEFLLLKLAGALKACGEDMTRYHRFAASSYAVFRRNAARLQGFLPKES